MNSDPSGIGDADPRRLTMLAPDSLVLEAHQAAESNPLRLGADRRRWLHRALIASL